MKGGKNNFRKGLFISLGLHLLIVCLLAFGVGRQGQVSPEPSIEVSLSAQAPTVAGKKPAASAPDRSKKPEKTAKKTKKTPKQQVKKPPQKKKARPKAAVPKKEKKPKSAPAKTKPALKPKEPATASKKIPSRTESETGRKEAAAGGKALESGKEKVIRSIKRESVLSGIKKSAELASAETAAGESGPGIISLVLDVYYRTISKRIQRSLVLPPNIDSGILLAAQVNFYMKETGEVYDVGIERSSGNPKFDSYCIKAVNDASPLPSPPSELRDRIKSEFFVISCESKR